MRARAAAREAAAALDKAGITDAAFEGEFLVRQATGMTRAAFFADPELSPAEREAVERLLERRLQREPAAYIAGKREFFGLEFELSPAVLVPRPETELLVEGVIAELQRNEGAKVVDIGTGSGCIAVSVARHVPAARVVATDISGDALSVAQRNARRHSAAIQFVRADLAAAIGHADVVVANLPYIPSDEVAELEPEVRFWEPAVALDGGGDGLALVRRLIDDCAKRLRPRLLGLEVGFGQAQAAAEYASSAGAVAEITRDLAGIERHVWCRWGTANEG